MSADDEVEIARLLAVGEAAARVSLIASGSKSTKPSARLDDHVVAEAMERALFGGTLDDILKASDSTNLEGAIQSDKEPRPRALSRRARDNLVAEEPSQGHRVVEHQTDRRPTSGHAGRQSPETSPFTVSG
jgi:hypothetical protein